MLIVLTPIKTMMKNWASITIKYCTELTEISQRYKGLGEMNPDQLKDTTLDPNQRMIKRINIEDAVEADRIFTMLMGDEVPPRKEFIIEKCKFAENIDA